MSRKSEKDLVYYMSLRYPIQIVECEEGGYFVRIPDLPGCMTQGETIKEALANIKEAKELWLEEMVESGLPIPEPAGDREHSGRFVVRMPRSLHERLAQESEREGVSLNQYVVSRLSAEHDLLLARDRPSRGRRR
ncbi:MAG: type II toxin-antitoxin system HicB family antitoxin [candidate division WOR-3 bacterium]|nr:type II toxin-antitoxin system HicB family antitoxin [candidate division WOR-3 bacterium]